MLSCNFPRVEEATARADDYSGAFISSQYRSIRSNTMIMLSNNTISAMAAANATIGTLSLVDSSGTVQKANWGLTPGAADYFLTAGNVLATARASIPAGFYPIHVRANTQLLPLKEKLWFVIHVS